MYLDCNRLTYTSLTSTANGTPLSGLDLSVSDRDLGENAAFSLSLEDISPSGSGGLFTVFPKQVVGRSPVILKVADSSRIDYERQDAGNFIVKGKKSHYYWIQLLYTVKL